MNNIAISICVNISMWAYNLISHIPRIPRIWEFSYSFKFLEVKLLVTLCLTLKETTKVFSKTAAPFYIPISNAWVFLFLHIFVNACYFLIFVCLFEYHYSSGFIRVISFVVFISSSLLSNDIEHSFMCLLTICVSSLENCSLTSFAHLLVGLLSSCLFVINSKYILYISHLSSYMIYKYFLLVCGFVLYLSCGVLWSANVFNNEVQFIKFLFYHLCFGAESLPNLASFVTLNF